MWTGTFDSKTGEWRILVDGKEESKLKLDKKPIAAEEAKELCLPIVTMGYGSLSERVVHEKTGFIAKTQKEFVNYSSLILNDNIVYKTLRQNLYNRRNSRNYSHVKKDLINILTNND